MTISAGTRLGPYEIVAPIGAGGMGEVYKARDTRLDRAVAVKILPAEFAGNTQLKVRFEREAKTISQLSHPNICTLYDVGENYLVMELLDGETLADRISRGPLPLADVLRFGMQIAEALGKAHREGIAHRDLKPGNVMITKSGAKLLDFGLAKSVNPPAGPTEATVQRPLTQEGTVLGTFQYMAPEQLAGEEPDARTDIFALGAVLYEMATGKRAFEGKTKTSLIAAIVSGEPKPISELQPLTPPALEHIVKKCLAKERDDRWQSAMDIAAELRWIGESGATRQVHARKPTERVLWIAALIATAAFAAAIGLRRPRPEPVVVSSIAAPPHAAFEFFDHAAISPDGQSIAFVGYRKSGPTLWIRPLDRNDPRELAGTEGAMAPFWSPDSNALGFFADGKLERIAVAGGPPQTICDADGPFPGGAWGRKDVILFSSGATDPLFRVPAGGGKPEAVTKLAPHDEAHRWPAFLPDGDHFLFLADANLAQDHKIRIGSLQDGTTRDLLSGITNAIVAEPGELLFVRGGSLLAQTFDAKSMTLQGEPRSIAENVVSNGDNHHFEFSASANGRLVYRAARREARLAWVDRGGNTIETLAGGPQRFDMFAIAPDQKRVAISHVNADGRDDDIWLSDLSRGMTTRLTFDPDVDTLPVWSPDGSRVAFMSTRGGASGDLYVLEVNNPTKVERLATAKESPLVPCAWSDDGRFLVLEYAKKTESDIYTYWFETHQLKPYLDSAFSEEMAALSPHSSWIAYTTNESGRREVYVERFPSHASRRQISSGGGFRPLWGADGRELFYVAPGGGLMSVDMSRDNAQPKLLFTLPGDAYDVARDGKRFLVKQPMDDLAKAPLTLLQNWTAGLK